MEMKANKFVYVILLILIATIKQSDGDALRLPDQQSSLNTASPPQQQHQQQSNIQQLVFNVQQQQQQQQQQNLQQFQNVVPTVQSPVAPAVIGEERRNGKGLLDLVGLGTGENVDPYVAKTNANCLTGDLSECFKSHALTSFNEIFTRDSYKLTNFARVVRMPENQQRALWQDPFEFSSEPRSTDSEWDQLIKFGLRKAERFIKSVALEVEVPEEFTENGRFAPRFIDDINSEIDVIEDKKATLFNRHRLKKLFIPMLLVLKIFKLKLLLFLPFILGLVGLKKVLGLAAIILPGLFAYFKLCKPQQNFGNLFGTNAHQFQQYSPHGIGAGSFQHHHENFYTGGGYGGLGGAAAAGNPYYREEPVVFSKPYSEYYSKNAAVASNGNGVRFADQAQDLAYQGYSEYRTNSKTVS